jgi:hypothetical protein
MYVNNTYLFVRVAMQWSGIGIGGYEFNLRFKEVHYTMDYMTEFKGETPVSIFFYIESHPYFTVIYRDYRYI